MESISLGAAVRDVVSGFTGIATARVEYINGCVQYCVQYCVQPELHEGRYDDARYFDHQQLQVVGDGVTAILQAAKVTGGPAQNTPPTSYRG